MRDTHLTEKLVQTLREMICGVEINNDIQQAEHEIENIRSKMLNIEYNELLKVLDTKSLEEIVNSRSIYDETETLIERIKTSCNVKITDEVILEKLRNMQEEIDMRQANINRMFEDLKDLTSYANKLQE